MQLFCFANTRNTVNEVTLGALALMRRPYFAVPVHVDREPCRKAAKKAIVCSLCAKVRFPVGFSTGHRRDGYCLVKQTCTRRSVIVTKIQMLEGESKKRGLSFVETDEEMKESFLHIRSKFLRK